MSLILKVLREIIFFFFFFLSSSESHHLNLSKETRVKTHVRLHLVHLQQICLINSPAAVTLSVDVSGQFNFGSLLRTKLLAGDKAIFSISNACPILSHIPGTALGRGQWCVRMVLRVPGPPVLPRVCWEMENQIEKSRRLRHCAIIKTNISILFSRPMLNNFFVCLDWFKATQLLKSSSWLSVERGNPPTAWEDWDLRI